MVLYLLVKSWIIPWIFCSLWLRSLNQLIWNGNVYHILCVYCKQKKRFSSMKTEWTLKGNILICGWFWGCRRYDIALILSADVYSVYLIQTCLLWYIQTVKTTSILVKDEKEWSNNQNLLSGGDNST